MIASSSAHLYNSGRRFGHGTSVKASIFWISEVTVLTLHHYTTQHFQFISSQKVLWSLQNVSLQRDAVVILLTTLPLVRPFWVTSCLAVAVSCITWDSTSYMSVVHILHICYGSDFCSNFLNMVFNLITWLVRGVIFSLRDVNDAHGHADLL